MEDTKDSNDWGGESERDGGWDRYSDQDRYSSRSSSKPGDWDCPSCQFSNFASRSACFKCRTPKDGDSFGSGGRVGGGMRDMRPGDWSCQKCQFHNFSSRGMCYKCNAPRGVVAVVTVTLALVVVVVVVVVVAAGLGNGNALVASFPTSRIAITASNAGLLE
ncbi:hypothetical protein OTU49_007519, partial [Cherax quadricarinatus]